MQADHAADPPVHAWMAAPPPWMNSEEYRASCHRLVAIDQELRAMGASEEYCLAYFQSGGGACERKVGGLCVRHRTCPTPLPPGRMCSMEFGQAAAMLRQQVQTVEAERVKLKRQWDSLKEEQTTLQFMAEPGVGRQVVRFPSCLSLIQI
jgi:hypothetical protein